jgi:hypothetical protein
MFRFAEHDSIGFDVITFDLVTFLTFLTFEHAYHGHRLSRRYFFLVFLVRTNVGGIEEAL